MSLAEVDSQVLLDKLFSRCTKHGECIVWAGAVTSAGYGLVGIPGTRKTITVHRLVFILANGEIPGNKLVLHSCSHKLCINPAHLSLGNHSDNLKQAWARSERVFGESRLQTKVRDWVLKHGGLCFKLSAGHAGGMPDLLILTPFGHAQMVELKVPGGRLSKRQVAVHAAFAKIDHDVAVIYSYADACKFLESLWATGAENVAC